MIMHGSGNQALVNSSAAHVPLLQHDRRLTLPGTPTIPPPAYRTPGRTSTAASTTAACAHERRRGLLHSSQVKNAKLYVTFGNNPAVTRASGGGQSWEFFSAARRNGTRMVFIDPIYSDTMAGRNAEWIPIRPGTDAALCEAIAYVLINENLVDKAFIDSYTIGYDEDSLPASAKPGSSYRSHILGLGPDKTPKTPERAAGITNVPAERIVRLARDMAAAKPCFISQGWAPQRRMNGETQSTSIAMLPILLGQIGLPGTNSGAREGDSYGLEAGLPTGANPDQGKPSRSSCGRRPSSTPPRIPAETAAVRGATGPRAQHQVHLEHPGRTRSSTSTAASTRSARSSRTRRSSRRSSCVDNADDAFRHVRGLRAPRTYESGSRRHAWRRLCRGRLQLHRRQRQGRRILEWEQKPNYGS